VSIKMSIERSIKTTVLSIVLLLVFSCKSKTQGDIKSEEVVQPTETILNFEFGFDHGLVNELASRVGCEKALKWVATPKKPFKELVSQLDTQKVPYEYLKNEFFKENPEFCKPSKQKVRMQGIKLLHDAVLAKGYGLTFVMVGGFGSHLTKDGALSLSRALWAQNLPKDSFRVQRVECLPNSYATDDVCMPSIRKQIDELQQSEGSRKHLYLMWGYSKGGTLSSQFLSNYPEFRNKVLALITVGAPFGGGLPMNAVAPRVASLMEGVEKLPANERTIFNALMMLGSGMTPTNQGVQATPGFSGLFTPEQRFVTRDGLLSVKPSSRSVFLRDKVSKWDMSRTEKHPFTGGMDTLIFHVAAAADVLEFKIAPTFKLNEQDRIEFDQSSTNVLQAAEMAVSYELMRHPLSDMCVALEHSVIPGKFRPRGLKNDLLAVLKMEHMSLGLSESPGANIPPGEEIVDSLIDLASQKLGVRP
jgi:hypothetical protein